MNQEEIMRKVGKVQLIVNGIKCRINLRVQSHKLTHSLTHSQGTFIILTYKLTYLILIEACVYLPTYCILFLRLLCHNSSMMGAAHASLVQTFNTLTHFLRFIKKC